MSDPAPLRVLLVDDDVAFQRALSRLLSGPRVVIWPVATIQAAQEALSKETVNVVLTDVHIGDQSGVALAEAILSSHAELRGRVILMSGSDEESLEVRARSLGCPLLLKPFAAGTFFALVSRLLGDP